MNTEQTMVADAKCKICTADILMQIEPEEARMVCAMRAEFELYVYLACKDKSTSCIFITICTHGKNRWYEASAATTDA